MWLELIKIFMYSYKNKMLLTMDSYVYMLVQYFKRGKVMLSHFNLFTDIICLVYNIIWFICIYTNINKNHYWF